MSGQDKTFFRVINRKYPWLKFGILAVLIALGVLTLMEILMPIRREEEVSVRTPMARHVKVPDRPLRVLDGKKLVALTFDDGPSKETTPRLLDILYDKGVVATFFELGTMARNNPEIVKRVVENGNEIGSHTMYHQNLGKLSASRIAADVNEAEAVFAEILGERPKLVRPPYGSVNSATRSTVNVPLILWTVDTLDWETKNTDMIVAEAKRGAFDGAIILMHDIYDTTVDAVPIIIDELRGMGYEFVTVSELASIRGVELETSVLYGSFRP